MRAKSDEGQSPWSAIGTIPASAAGKDSVRIAANTPPVIGGPASVTIEVPENTPGNLGDAFGATDADGDAITWSVGGTDASSFEIGVGGQLSLASGVTLNYETQTSYSITVTVSDATDSDSVAVTVTVTDVDEPPGKPPAMTLEIVGVRIESILVDPENTGPPLGKYWAQFREADEYSAADPDPAWRDNRAGYDPTRTNSPTILALGVFAGKKKEFRLQAENGEGYGEWSDSFYLIMSSSSSGNQRPVIHTRSIYGLAIDENTVGAIGAAMLATELNSGDTLTWSLTGANASLFAISSSGQLSVVAPGLDYEAAATRTVTVKVSDGTDSDSEDVTVKVNDIQDEEAEAPVIGGGASQTITVAENTTSNIGSAFSATDADGDAITWSKGGSAGIKFNINSAGQLSVKSDAGLNYEVDGASLQFTVIASDGNGGSDSVAVSVTVTDANDPPVIGGPDSVSFTVAENTPGGSAIGTAFSASDADPSDTWNWSLGGADKDSFNITGGQLQLASGVTLDFETKPSHSITVIVTDNNGDTASVAVTVTVTDANDPAGHRRPRHRVVHGGREHPRRHRQRLHRHRRRCWRHHLLERGRDRR